MTIEITYKNCNRFVMMAGSLDHPEEMKDVLDFMDPLGVSEVESGDVTIDSHKDGAEITITLKLVRVGDVQTPETKKPRMKRKPRKTRKAASKSSPPPAYSEPPEAAGEDEGDDTAEDNAQEAAAAAQRFAKAKAAVRGAKKSNPPPADDADDEVDPLGDLEEALGGEAKAQPF